MMSLSINQTLRDERYLTVNVQPEVSRGLADLVPGEASHSLPGQPPVRLEDELRGAPRLLHLLAAHLPGELHQGGPGGGLAPHLDAVPLVQLLSVSCQGDPRLELHLKQQNIFTS